MRVSEFPQMSWQAIDNIPSWPPCTILQPSSSLAGRAQPVASIFHAMPTSITSLPAPLRAPREHSAGAAAGLLHQPCWSAYWKFLTDFSVLGTESRTSCLLLRDPPLSYTTVQPLEGLWTHKGSVMVCKQGGVKKRPGFAQSRLQN